MNKFRSLPKWMQDLATRYPISVENVLESQNLPLCPSDYRPRFLELFYGESLPRADIAISVDGEEVKLIYYSRRQISGSEPIILKIRADDEWVYIQIGNRVLLDRLGENFLPNYILARDAFWDRCQEVFVG